ncbi:hypothetical protein F2Q68_00003417 [Brassica cretica]|uniref:Leucine-rich repeat-containing N-terminal plant-type domain-containing protein n=1 Tax=Brassica cretica TaxID=69181 RepID=A0A8S9JI40_BRACR|nr:hypothetical protein F2Q68_00003417 [Brassica cretica]
MGMASLRFLHVFFFFHLILHCHSLSGSSDAKLLVGKIKPSLQGASESLLLSSWNSSVPVCQWRGKRLEWVEYAYIAGRWGTEGLEWVEYACIAGRVGTE